MRQSALAFAGTMVLNVGNFAFHAIAGRKLGVEEYGTLYALISAYSIGLLPGSAFAPVVSRLAAEFHTLHDDGHMRGLLRSVTTRFLAIGGLCALVGFLVAQPLSRFINVPSWTIPLLGIMVTSGLFVTAARSLTQGVQDFSGYAVSNICEGVAKVATLAGCVMIGFGLIAGVVGVTVGLLFGTFVVVARLYARYRRAPVCAVRYDWPRIMKTSGGSATVIVATTLLGSLDVLFVKHFFDPTSAGLYSAAALGGKMVLYLIGFVPAVLLPQATARFVRGERTRHSLLMSLGVFFVLASAGVLGIMLFGPQLLRLLVGPAFAASATLLPWYTVAMVFLMLTNLLSSYGFATHRLLFVAPMLVCAIGTLAAIAFVHPSLLAVIQILVIGNAITAATTAAALAWQGVRAEGAIDPDPA